MKMESDLRKSGHESDSGDKSDGDLVVDSHHVVHIPLPVVFKLEGGIVKPLAVHYVLVVMNT